MRALPIALSVILAWPAAVSGQENDGGKKVGLVLSGGGAKGICHIGVLKVLEEEGIRPQIITGTSMGSLVGGLYACGYSAADIERIVLDIRWDELMTNKVGLDKIAIEEKRYYGRWIVELPFDHGPRLPTGLIRGQKIQELVRHHTLPFHGTSDFSKLPIPFMCVATDVGRGEAVMQDHGFLPAAMRASMSIPTFFTPLLSDSIMLVDGGEMRNFPVSDARERGADLVIGVEVSEGLVPADQLISPIDILTQSAMFHSLRDNDRQRSLCDVLILPDYAPYSTGSFEEAAAPYLIAKGYAAADALRPQLRELARQAGMGPGPVTPPGVRLPDSLRVDRLEIHVPDGNAKGLVAARFKKNKHRLAVTDLEQRIDLLYGSRHFDLVQYRVRPEGVDSVLVIEAAPAAPGRIGASVNYDTYHEVSVGVLFQIYDQLLPASRAAVEGYVGRYPSFDLDYLKYLGPSRHFAAELGGYYDQGPAFARDATGRTEAEFTQFLRGGSLRLRTTDSRSFSAGVQAELRSVVQRPSVYSLLQLGTDEEPLIVDLADIERIRGSWTRAGVFAQYNTVDEYVYPTRGWEVLLSAATHEQAVTELSYTDEYLAGLDPDVATLIKEITADLSPYDRYLRGTMEWRGRIPVSRRGTVISEGAFSMTDEPDLLATDQITLGGFRRPDRTSLPFLGLKEFDGEVTDLAMLTGGVQWRLGRKVYWQAVYNAAWTGFRKEDNSLILGERFIQGYGITLGAKGVFGLVQLGVATNTSNHQVVGWFNFGFRL